MSKYFENFYDWWKNIDKHILTLVLGLFILGLFFSLVSTSLIASDKLNTNSYYFFLKHLSFILLGIIFLLFFSILKQKTLIKISIIFFFISFFCLFLVPFLGIEVKGSKRWLDPFFLPRFQPIEILKPFFIIIISILLSLNNRKLYLKYIFSSGILIPILLLLISQPDLGQSLLITLSWLALIFVSGINILLFFSFFITAGITVSYLVFFVPKFEYIKLRLITFIDSSSGNNYQSEKASDAIINGGFFGKGIGEGTLNSRVPEAHTDYIVSVISEEFGVIVIILILILFLNFIFSIFKKVNVEKDHKTKLILVGSASLILFQAMIHIGVNIRLFPTTGMTLPFLSYGGSSIISISILSGIILNLTKRKI